MIDLKVEYMEPFVQAACAVLEKICGSRANASPPGLSGSVFPSASTNVAARLDGSLRGDVIYSMSGQSARKLTRLITGDEPRSFGRAQGSGLNALGAMFAEETNRVLTNRGLFCKMSPPIIFRGLSVEFAVTEPALGVRIESGAGAVNVSVAVTNGKQN